MTSIILLAFMFYFMVSSEVKNDKIRTLENELKLLKKEDRDGEV